MFSWYFPICSNVKLARTRCPNIALIKKYIFVIIYYTHKYSVQCTLYTM